MDELARFCATGAIGGLYDTSVERNEDGSEFWINQVRQAGMELGGTPETDDVVYLDEHAARALYLTLKAHFEP
ncbi:hypothetical protein LGN43_10545 [Burkholderia multivorans]|nr:hypothetical protein [Burkholderia multivorans]